jgi:hypothetical protein
VFSLHMEKIFYGYDKKMFFLAIWANFSMGMMSGGCVFCPYEDFFPWIHYKTMFSGNLGLFFYSNDVRGLCFLSP